MSLRKLFEQSHVPPAAAEPPPDLSGIEPARPPERTGPGFSTDAYLEMRERIHTRLLDRIDLSALDSLAPDKLRAEIRVLVERLLSEEQSAVNENERNRMVQDIQYEVMGLGPLEPLLADPSISEIMVNSAKMIYVERRGKIELTDVQFRDDAHLMKIIDRIVSAVGRRVDEANPMVDARLADGSRVNAVIPPLTLDGPCMSIRRFSVIPLTIRDLVEKKSLTAEMAELVAGLVKAKTNILIAGGTGTGKTTMLNILSSFIPSGERIITIEDAAELQLQQPHVIRMETRPPNIEGKGEITQRHLVKNSLRMRPDRIILGEVRGPEAFDMLQAMNTGHEGSLATVHANTPREALTRLENMISMANLNLPHKVVREQIASAITAVVQITRLQDGQRKMVSITEITGMEGELITMQEIFRFEQTGVAADGTVQGQFQATGIRPKFMEKLVAHGVHLRDDLFVPRSTPGK